MVICLSALLDNEEEMKENNWTAVLSVFAWCQRVIR